MSIKLSAETITLLSNFAAINKGILLKPGKAMKTLSANGAAAASVSIVEDFPHQVPISDITNFLNVLSLFVDPVIEFNDSKTCMTITDANDTSRSTRFLYSAPELMKSPTGAITLTGPTLNFKLSESQLAVLVKATSVLKKPEWAVLSDGKTIKIVTYNHEDPQSTDFSLVLEGQTNGVQCTSVFKVMNINLLKGNYDVVLSEQVAQFTRNGSDNNLVYWVGAEATSKYNGRGATTAGN